MCGITGFYSPNGLSFHRLPHMVSSLKHRGPDAENFRLFTQSQRHLAGLGTARLSIVGRENGEQPVSCPTGRWWVCLNGEIYNHQALRREAVGNGVEPLNDSDTAVISALLSFLPLEKVIERLRGMFALAIYDKQEHQVWLFRDRMGVKPLYWTQDQDGTLYWASEVRALSGLHSHQINDLAVQHLLCFEYIPSPLSIWKNVHKLQPAHFLHQKQREITQQEYWDFPIQNPEAGGSKLHWQKSLRLALDSATRLRLQADVPVGTLLSGGIDSATITAIASQKQRNIHSFSVAIEEEGFNERSAIEENLQHFSVQSQIFSFSKKHFLPIFEKMTKHLDEPLADSSLLVTWFLFQQIRRKGLKCVLSGDGADEIFAGYPTYLAHKYLPSHFQFPTILQPLLHKLPSSTQGVSWDYMLKRFAQSHEDSWWKNHQLWSGAWFPSEVSSQEQLWNIANFWSQKAGTDRTGRAMFLDQRLYLAEGVLSKVDRASMAHGVEVRSPFLDHHIVSLASDIPMALKLNHRGGKQILRSLLPNLSPNTQKRKKKGFGSPIALWLQQDDADLCSKLPEKLSTWINPTLMKKTIAEHKSGKIDHRRRLWSAIILERWLSRWT